MTTLPARLLTIATKARLAHCHHVAQLIEQAAAAPIRDRKGYVEYWCRQFELAQGHYGSPQEMALLNEAVEALAPVDNEEGTDQ